MSSEQQPQDRDQPAMTLLRERWHSTIDDHRLVSGTLVPPLAEIPGLEALDGSRDLLPELLWIDAVLRVYSVGVALKHLDAVLAAIDTVKPEGHGVLGTVSELMLPVHDQAKVLAALTSEQRALSFPSPFREGMALYPEFPGRYLFTGLELGATQVVAVEWIRESVLRLFDRRSETGARANFVLYRGLFRANRISIPAKGTEDLQAALLAYPHGTKDQNAYVEATARASINGMSTTLLPADHAWPRHFWRMNWSLARCQPLV